MLQNLEFKYPSNLVFFVFVLAAIIFLILGLRKKEKIMARLHLNSTARFKVLRAVLLGVGLSLIAVAAMGPQAFQGYVEVSKAGLDIYVLMDTSKSMLAADIAPDRLSVAKRIVGTLLDQLAGDRIGFIPFASDAYIQMPLTDDYQLARMFLNVMDTEMISGGGSNLAAAISLAADSFQRASSADKVILILSDGEDHDGASLEAVKKITDQQVKIYSVGIGTELGGVIPVYDHAGSTVIDYLKDAEGNTVISKLASGTLRQLAQDGGGVYFQAALDGAETAALIRELSALKRDEYQMERVKRFAHLYQYFLGPGLLLFALAWLLPERRSGA